MNQHKSSSGVLTNVSRSIKSLLDRVMAAFLLLLFSPILLVVAIVLRVRMGTPHYFHPTASG